MSYDLYFRSDGKVSVEALRAYFAEQPHFELSDARAHYENEATGVYFGFNFSREADGELVPLAFNMNYFRPHVFGLEAALVVTDFIEAHGLGVSDPQAGGMGEGPYSRQGFLDGWNAGNRFGHRALLSMENAPEPLTLPAARIEGNWRWNFGKDLNAEAMVDLIGDVPPCFLPSIMLFQMGEREVTSLVVWDTSMAIAIPEVDLVLTKAADGLRVMPANDLLGMVDVHTTWRPDFEIVEGLPVGSTTRLIDEVPARVSEKIRASMRPFQPIRRVGLDTVLDAELVAEASARG